MIKEKTLANNEQFFIEMEEKGTDSETSSEDHKEEWDAETILTTYTNTDNHPSVIKFNPKVRVNKKA